jgi:general secretion pathway protein A
VKHNEGELFLSEGHREAMAHLVYGVRGGGGFVVLTGEPGTGKTATVKAFVRQLPTHCRVACLGEPRQGVDEMLRGICREFALAQLPPRASRRLCIEALNAFLLKGHARGRQALLVVDDAHLLAPEVLEQLRLLTNLETAERKLLQIFLVGRPGLRDTLVRPAFEQLAQRVVARCELRALARDEVGAYVAHRLAQRGLGRQRVDGAAQAALHRLTGGVPRELDRVIEAGLAMSAAAGAIDRVAVRRAAAGLHPQRRSQAGPGWWVARLRALLVKRGTSGDLLQVASDPTLSGGDRQPPPRAANPGPPLSSPHK